MIERLGRILFTVKQDGNGDFNTISQAIESLGVNISFVPGDTILVFLEHIFRIY